MLLAHRIDLLKIAIAKREGFGAAQNVPTRLNNPGDLMYARQTGAIPEAIVGSDGKVRNYARFATLDAGWAALEAQIRLDASRGLTLAQFISKYAPAGDGNDPTSYLAFVMRALGLQDPQMPLADVIA